MAARDRSNEIATLLAEGIDRLLKATLPAASAEVSDVISLGDDDMAAWLAEAKNLRVYVVPLEPVSRVLTRRHDECDYPFAVVFVEQCQTSPTVEWVAARAALAEKVMDEFGDVRKPLQSGLDCQFSEVVSKIDDRYLVQHQSYWSEAKLVLQEVVIRG